MRADHYEAHFALEQDHWWFVGRRNIVLHLLNREIASDPHLHAPLRLLDVGTGGGGILPYLSRYGSVIAVDPEPAAVAAASARSFDVRKGGLPSDLPFGPDEKFDVITMLDVIEHVEQDLESLINVRRLLMPHGRIIVTVPAFQFLWSGHDVINEHKRRYRNRELRAKLERAGFKVRLISYCNSALFLPIAAVRLGRRRFSSRDETSPALGTVPRLANAFLAGLFGMERHVIPMLPLPFGVSVVAVATPEHRQ